MMSAEKQIAELEATGDYRVLRRHKPIDCFSEQPIPPERVKILMVVDVETTGLDSTKDRIIDLGYLLVEFDQQSGQLHRVIERYSGLEDPGFSIPAHITQLSGLRDDDVRGQHLDDDKVAAAIERANLVIAHNAKFDRGFLERRFPAFQQKWWACSQEEAPWTVMMTGSKKQEWLAYLVGGIFYDAHRALVDAEVLLYLLSRPGPEERTILSHVLEQTKKKAYRVWAEQSPFEKRDVLKAKGYRWNDGTDPDRPIKAWNRFPVWDLDAELEMLATEIYARPASVTVDVQLGRDRYTDRISGSKKMSLPVVAADSVEQPKTALDDHQPR